MTRLRLLKISLILSLVVGLAACVPQQPDNAPLPTLMQDLDAAATAQVMTQNAPPPRFRESLTLPSIEAGLSDLSQWRYTVTAEFKGTFAGTSRPAEATTTAEVTYHQLTSARRVILTAAGSLLTEEEQIAAEAVRIGRDVYLVNNGQCSVVTDTDAAEVVEAGAGLLIGGITGARPTGTTGIINGENVFRYELSSENLQLASIIPRSEGSVTLNASELWFSGEHAATVRLYLTLTVQNATVFGSQLPVDGQIILRFDLMDIGQDANISVPFGC